MAVLTFDPQHSSHVQRLSYNPDHQNLQITFKNGSTYSHIGVPSEVFAAMTRAASAGKYYHNVIKRHYRLLSVTTKENHGSQGSTRN